MTGRRHAARGLVALMAVLTACASRGRPGPAACGPIEAISPADVATEWLEGEFAVTLVATEGPRDGAWIMGSLVLRPQEPHLRTVPGPGGQPYPGVTMPLVGTAELALDSVGAAMPGALDSADPEAPGVAVLRQPDGTMLRLGANANRRGVFAFDGAFTVLQVLEATTGGFRGTWSSGGGEETAQGYFCAVRRDD